MAQGRPLLTAALLGLLGSGGAKIIYTSHWFTGGASTDLLGPGGGVGGWQGQPVYRCSLAGAGPRS